MTDPYRYLPCGLHEALTVPVWAKIKNGDLCDGSPYSLAGPLTYGDGDPRFFIDLAHPTGWDHAVRAYVAICGGTVGESRDVRFDVFCADDGWEPDGYNGETIPGRRIPDVPTSRWYEPAARREALCRCICAALNLRVEEVFP